MCFPMKSLLVTHSCVIDTVWEGGELNLYPTLASIYVFTYMYFTWGMIILILLY